MLCRAEARQSVESGSTMRYVARALPVIALVLPFSACVLGQPEGRSLRVAPNSGATPETCAPGLCDGGELSFKIDGGPVQPWPKSEILVISGLSATERHRIAVYRAAKRQQSFSFSFSNFQAQEPCLFLDNMYWTARLWETRRAPWCRRK